MREAWYLLEDGSLGDPNDVAPDETGRLIHKNGAAVAMRGSVPHTRNVDPDEERLVAASRSSGGEKAKTSSGEGKPDEGEKDMKPETLKRGYKTRESKVE